LNSNPGQFCFVFLLSLFHLENHVCLSRGVQVAGAAWRAATRIMTGVGDLVHRSGTRSSKHVATVFSGLASKHVATVFSSLALKPMAMVFSNLASNLVATVSPGLASKPVVDFLVKPQNQGGGGFPGLGLKTNSFDLVIWASKSPRRFFGLGLKTIWASVCRLSHKTDRERSAWDMR
jgi:hypothetical protein